MDLFAVQGALKSLLQHHSSKASTLRCSPFFMVQLSHPQDQLLVLEHSRGSRMLSGTIAPRRRVNPQAPKATESAHKVPVRFRQPGGNSLHRPVICHPQRRVALPAQPSSHLLSHAGPSEDSGVGCPLRSLQMQPQKPAALLGGDPPPAPLGEGAPVLSTAVLPSSGWP